MRNTPILALALIGCAGATDRDDPVDPLRGLDTYSVRLSTAEAVLFETEGLAPYEDVTEYRPVDSTVCAASFQWNLRSEGRTGSAHVWIHSHEAYRDGSRVELGRAGLFGWTSDTAQLFSTNGGELEILRWTAGDRTAIVRGAELCADKFGTLDCEPVADLTFAVRHVAGADGPEWPYTTCVRGTEGSPHWDIWDGPPPCFIGDEDCG